MSKTSRLLPSDYREEIEERLSRYLKTTRCTRCLLPAGFRSIRFDSEGICNYCHDYQALAELVNSPHRHQKFVEILENSKSREDTPYDCVVCLSGGKDSIYLLDLLKEKYKLKVISVTVDTGFLSSVARENIQKAISRLNVNHVFLDAPDEILDIYRYGFTRPGGKGIECEVCDLCDGIIRSSIAQFAIDQNIPLIADGLDPFQLIDAGLHRPDPGIEKPLSCWPERLRQAGLFKDLYRLDNFNHQTAPFELYPFLYLPYDPEFIEEYVEEKEIIVDPDPNVTNCQFTYLLDFTDLMRKGFPAYIHNISSYLRQGKIDRQEAEEWIEEAFLEYASGTHDEGIFEALKALGLSLESIIHSDESWTVLTHP